MHDINSGGCGCGCGSGCTCGTLPAEFVRVRYYYGQRLGVMELGDQFLYHAGKMAFHNVRLHGAGVICGLRAEKQKPPAGTQSTVLRISTGAALDPCGRELVVGIDQCIDVAAWVGLNRSRPALAGWTANTTQTLRVAIRYRECPSDPSPAPRDPCGCDNGGCEYGRVREAFELGLFTADEKICAAAGAPSMDALLASFDSGGGAGPSADPARSSRQRLAALLAQACPMPADPAWLCLASFTVTLDGSAVPIDLSDPDNTIPERLVLLSTRAIQDLLIGLASDAATSGLLSSGPRPGPLQFTASATDPAKAGELAVPVVLAKAGSPAVDVPLVDATFDPATISVARLDATGWTDITPAGGVAYDNTTTPPRLVVTFTGDLAPSQPFLLAFQPAATSPTVDVNGAPLGPFTRPLRFVLDASGSLALDATA
ncbi:MAG: hypothetical protein ABI665_21175 [Vicinamibacterales bacterium]